MKPLNPIFCCQTADNTKRTSLRLTFESSAFIFSHHFGNCLMLSYMVDKNSVYQKVNRNIHLVMP